MPPSMPISMTMVGKFSSITWKRQQPGALSPSGPVMKFFTSTAQVARAMHLRQEVDGERFDLVVLAADPAGYLLCGDGAAGCDGAMSVRFAHQVLDG